MLWKQLFELTCYCLKTLKVISLQGFQTLVEHRKLQLQPVKLVLWDTGGSSYKKVGAVQSPGGLPL